MLLDTSGLLCLVHQPEPFRELALAQYEAASFRLLHNYVLAEFIALAHVRRVPRQLALRTCADFQNDLEIELVWVDEPLHREALDFLTHRLDKTYSLCDAVSFLLMRRLGIVEALTTDAHFEQEGFRRLLCEPA